MEQKSIKKPKSKSVQLTEAFLRKKLLELEATKKALDLQMEQIKHQQDKDLRDLQIREQQFKNDRMEFDNMCNRVRATQPDLMSMMLCLTLTTVSEDSIPGSEPKRIPVFDEETREKIKKSIIRKITKE